MELEYALILGLMAGSVAVPGIRWLSIHVPKFWDQQYHMYRQYKRLRMMQKEGAKKGTRKIFVQSADTIGGAVAVEVTHKKKKRKHKKKKHRNPTR
jgi:hypothetical protein